MKYINTVSFHYNKVGYIEIPGYYKTSDMSGLHSFTPIVTTIHYYNVNISKIQVISKLMLSPRSSSKHIVITFVISKHR